MKEDEILIELRAIRRLLERIAGEPMTVEPAPRRPHPPERLGAIRSVAVRKTTVRV